jgi:hypothetical protein
VRIVIEDALHDVAPSLKELAPPLGVSYGMLRRFAIGDLAAPVPVVRALVRVLRARARLLGRTADRLDAHLRTARKGTR